jgi:hypothetical protein
MRGRGAGPGPGGAVPVPETAEAAPGEPVRPVPEAVPAGAWPLPLVALPQPVLNGAPRPTIPAREDVPGPFEYEGASDEVADPWAGGEQKGNSAADQVYERAGIEAFKALLPEGWEPEDDSPPPPGEDTLTAAARRDFLADLMDGSVPSIRTLRGRYGIGQGRATRIQSELKKGLS